MRCVSTMFFGADTLQFCGRVRKNVVQLYFLSHLGKYRGVCHMSATVVIQTNLNTNPYFTLITYVSVK